MSETTRNVAAATTKACAACPWRESNQGKPHPHHWYTQANLRRLWAGLRTGEAPGMTCHPTDPDNEVPEGHKSAPETAKTQECAGALLLIIRELRRLEKESMEYFKTKGGLTKDGVQWWGIARCKFAGVPFVGGPAIPMVEEDADIQRPGIRV